MPFHAWLFSARRAWQHPLIRWLTVAAALAITCGSVFFLWKVIPARRSSGTVILHYNLYLGIDQVQAWYWAFLLPAVWLAVTAIDFAFAYSLYNKDTHVSLSLALLGFVWCLPWILALYYLSRVNV